MSHPLSVAAILEKNKLNSPEAFIVLLEITLPDSTVLRVSSDTSDTVWPASGGETFVRFPFELDELGETNKGEVPQVVIRVSNVTRAIQGYLEAANGGVGSDVVLRVVHSETLAETTPILQFNFICTVCTTSSEWATFTLGGKNPHRMRYPLGRVLSNSCRWVFKSTQCGYSGVSTECDKTLVRCRELNNSGRYGGFPGVSGKGVYV